MKYATLSWQRRPACQTLLKALNISSAIARVPPDLLKAQVILSDTEDLQLIEKT